MDNKKQKSFISDSTLLNSLNLHTTVESSFLTSTQNQESTLAGVLNNNRRKAIIPTPNRSTFEPPLNFQKNPDDQVMTNTIVSNNMEYEYLKTKNKPSNDLKQDGINNYNDHQLQVDENNEERDFDTLILQHFIPFSGKQAVNHWLDETEGKLNQLKISRHLRFEAIPLLVEGNAKRLYIKNRNEIRSFDDFYEFLLLHFDANNSIISQVQPCSTSTGNFSYQKPSGRLESNTDSGRKSMNTSDATHFPRQPPALRSTAIVDFCAISIIGETLDNKSTKVITNSSLNILDQITNDLRKAIVEDLIKNPKVFKGSKDDVNKWIEDIEHLLNIAHVPEPSRLDLISYSLRGDALQWFKN